MTQRARELRDQGIPVISLSNGEPDFASPGHAIEAAYKAALAGDTKYPPQGGTPALKAAIARKFKRDDGLDYGPDEIIVGNGGKQVIFDAFMATLDPGRRGGDPIAVLDQLCRYGEGRRRRARGRATARRITASSRGPRISRRRLRPGPNGCC